MWSGVFRWMYPFERYMKGFKGYVRNRIYPEGCIAESYIVEEAVEFCSQRMFEEATIGLPARCKSESTTSSKPLSGATMLTVHGRELHLAHLCVLQDTTDARPYFNIHMDILKRTYPKSAKNEKWLVEKQNLTFASSIKKRVASELKSANNHVSETMRWMANGPNNKVPTFSGYQVNEIDFNTKQRDNVRSTQNSGVFLLANAMQVATAKDKNPINDDMHFYGVIQKIWELNYHKFRVAVFKCDWVESTRGIKVDDLWFTLINLNKLGHLSDPFVLAIHVKQIFYIQDYQDDDGDEELENEEVEQQPFIVKMPSIETFDDVVGVEHNNYIRDGDEGIWVEKDNGPRV